MTPPSKGEAPTGDLPPSSEIELGYLARNVPFLTRVLRAFIRAENADIYHELGIEQGEIALLSLIGINPGVSQNDLAAAVVIRKSAVTKIVKQLEKRGYIARRKSRTDRRFNALSLTKAGEDKRAELQALMRRQHAELLDGFSTEDQDKLFELLNRLLADLAARRDDRENLPDTEI